MKNRKNDVTMNEDIMASEIRCIGDDGTQYGIISKNEALNIAYEKNLDLVVVTDSSKPIVCKIMDYGKFKYQQEKKKKEARKNQKVIVQKEIKLSVKIADNDIGYKIKHAREFLEAGNHVRFRVFLKGREMANPDAGKEVLRRVWKMVEDIAVLDKDIRFEGRYVNMTTLPRKDDKIKK